MFITIITCAGTLPAQVIDYTIDPTFNSGILFNRGKVYDLMVTSQNDYMVMGWFLGYDSPIEVGSLITNTGQLIEPNMVGGSHIIEYQNFLLQYNLQLRMLDFNGIQTPFRFEFAKNSYSGPLSDYVYDAMVTPDENILAAGRFFTDSTLLGTSQSHLALRQLCMVDSTGAPVPDFPMLRCNQPVDAAIFTLDSLSTGEYIIAGHFSEVEGHQSHKIAKLNADFSVNTEFTSPFSLEGYQVIVLLVDSQDRIWVLKSTPVNIVNQPNYPSLLVRLLPDGSIDESYQVNVFTTYAGDEPFYSFNTSPTNILEDDDGTFILSGNFIEVNGEPHNRLIKTQDNGEIIPNAFGGLGADEAVWDDWWVPSVGPIVGTSIRKILKLPDGKLLVGGQFSSFGGEPYSCLVRLQPSGFVGIDEKEGRGKLEVYPNPADNFIKIKLPQLNQEISLLEIITVQGKVVKQIQNFHQDDKVSINGLSSGIYIVTAKTGKGVFTQKLVVE
ncbi:T9SS type A sorting domain-containing protein [Cryomorpha ignava]|uniref:T9SS type A sorting domain-containing protein n=2 Tax=Cryomorpha ignava TaxID=101383 RepID=A0A7K3WY21_9FLAO|nr:T9SS type A sorting domain-containing protein [Cryomorpha ignava]